MKVFLRMIELRFDIFKPREEQVYCPVGMFYCLDGDPCISNFVINHDSEISGLPILLEDVDRTFVFAHGAKARGLESISIFPLYVGRQEFCLRETIQIEVPDGTAKIDKHLFMSHIASLDRFKPTEGSRLYRRMMTSYHLAPFDPPPVVP